MVQLQPDIYILPSLLLPYFFEICPSDEILCDILSLVVVVVVATVVVSAFVVVVATVVSAFVVVVAVVVAAVVVEAELFSDDVAAFPEQAEIPVITIMPLKIAASILFFIGTFLSLTARFFEMRTAVYYCVNHIVMVFTEKVNSKTGLSANFVKTIKSYRRYTIIIYREKFLLGYVSRISGNSIGRCYRLGCAVVGVIIVLAACIYRRKIIF